MPTVLGSIASFYYVTHKTVYIMANALSVNEKSFEEILKILSSVPEFQELPVRHNED